MSDIRDNIFARWIGAYSKIRKYRKNPKCSQTQCLCGFREFYKNTCCPYLTTLLSGSPLIQNGKLIGAITHVLVDDPTTGYAIFAENMLETAQSVADENKLKDAS